jgi:hypothetical protein
MKKLAILLAMFVVLTPLVLEAGSIRGEIKPAPWSGDWWSRRTGLLVKGWPGHQPSPFEKFDRYVIWRTGKNPGVHAWESDPRNNHYNPNAEGWEGHCNGWAAAAILTPEPTISRQRGGIVFTTADQKGYLSEQYMNCYCNFYGNRFWGNPGDDPNDIYPDEFHRLLIKYIASGKSAMVVDIEPGRMVWNFPLFKFESRWSTGWFDDKKLKVTTDCYYVNDDVHPDYIGSKWFKITYTYNLYLDAHGNIVSGEWTGASKNNHPDFVWVPTSDALVPANSTLENPRMDPRFVREICEGPAQQASSPQMRLDPDFSILEAGLDPNVLF